MKPTHGTFCLLLVSLVLLPKTLVIGAPATPLPAEIRVDATESQGALRPIWRFFGADEPNYATMKNGRELLHELGKLRPKYVYFRAHNLLNTDGTPALKGSSAHAYTEDEYGNPIYNWSIIDSIFDMYIERGVRPYVEIGFMPKALSSEPDAKRGVAAPPKDYKKWAELVYQWVNHSVERYGSAEVEKWYWEVWNEPNVDYWHGTPEEFFKLHDYAIDAVRRALPTARVGGPHAVDVDTLLGKPTVIFKWMENFMRHVSHGTNYATGKKGTPTDFLSFHAKGFPTFVDGHVRMGIAAQLRTIDVGFATIASMPELKDKPIVIGESDPDGCAVCLDPKLGYRNSTMYSSYTAASFARKYELAERHGVNLEGALTWAFEVEDRPIFAGFRVLSSNGLDLPVLNVFRMFANMGNEQIRAKSSAQISLDEILQHGVRNKPDIGVLASRDGRRISVMIWHYHDDDVPGPDAAVELRVSGLVPLSGTAQLVHYRIDEYHSNSHAAWKRLGSPSTPSDTVFAALEQAGELGKLSAPGEVKVEHGTTTLEFSLPRQAVSLLVLELPACTQS